MPSVIGKSATAQGEDGWRCLTCQDVFSSSAAVRRHWERFNEGHSVFVAIATGCLHHQTIEGLHERDWTITEETEDHEEATSGQR